MVWWLVSLPLPIYKLITTDDYLLLHCPLVACSLCPCVWVTFHVVWWWTYTNSLLKRDCVHDNIQFNYECIKYRLLLRTIVQRGHKKCPLSNTHTHSITVWSLLIKIIILVLCVCFLFCSSSSSLARYLDRDRDVGMQITQSTLLLLSESVLAEEK